MLCSCTCLFFRQEGVGMMKIKLMQTIYASDLKSRAILVMNYLIFRANKEGTCFPAIKTIAKECNISVNTVKRALSDLVNAGYVQKDTRFIKEKNGAQTSNLYTLSTGMFVSDNIEIESDEAADEIQAICQDEPIEQESFKSMAAGIPKSNMKIASRSTADEHSQIYPGADKLVHNKNAMFSEGFSLGFHEWAAPRPTLIPP